MGICLGMTLEEKVDILQCTPLYELGPLKLGELAKYFKTVTTLSDTTVYEEGDSGDTFYVIAEGEVVLNLNDPSTGRLYRLCTKHKGDFFGDQALFEALHLRSTNAYTTSECVLLVLSQRQFIKYIQASSVDTRKVVADAMGKGMKDVLRKLPFLQGVDATQLTILSSLFQYVTVPQGGTVFRQGEEGQKMYIVAQGSVMVLATGSDGEEKEMATLGPGSHFGEIALMVNMPRTATVVAKEPTLLLSLTKNDFTNFIALLPSEIEQGFETAMRKRTAELFKLFQVPFFEAIPERLFMNIANVCEICQFNAGQVIYQEGDVGSSFYIVINGLLHATVTKDGKELELREYSAGTYFGELALVRPITRPATVTTLTQCALLCFTRMHFDEFFQQFPEHRAAFEVKLARQDASIDAVLGTELGLKYFTEHLRNEYSAENIRFWGAVRLYRDLNDADRKEMALEITNLYIRSNGDEQVNISAKQQRAIVVEVDAGMYPPGLFDVARDEIEKLMSRDSLPRFKQTILFQHFLRDIGAVEDVYETDDDTSRKSSIVSVSRERSGTAAVFGRLMKKKKRALSPRHMKVQLQ